VRTRRTVGLVVMALLASLTPVAVSPSRASAAMIAGLETVDLERPRVLMRQADLPVIRERVEREPYRSLVESLAGRISSAPPPNAGDQADCVARENRDREGAKAKAAKNAAFLYTIDRIWDGVSQAVVAPSPTERDALGDLVRDYLLFMCTESRIKENIDRDINTSHELAQMAIAYDTLKGGGYDFGVDEEQIIDNLVALTSEFYGHYRYPEDYGAPVSVGSKYLVNNHRSKGAASIGTAALVLAEYEPQVGQDPKIHTPAHWLDFALDRVDLVQRHTYGTPDGAYGEAPQYWRFAAINLMPFLRAWDGLIDGASWTTADGLSLPSLWRHPQFHAMQRWMLDTSTPDGSIGNFDDSNVGLGFWFGGFPADFPDAAHLYWRWVNGTNTYDSDASIDMSADQIVTFDDALVPEEPTGSPTRFYPEGGNAVFRSDWSEDARVMLVQAEHGAAREFGRLRDGRGEAYSAAHDQPDPGAYELYAYGERLMLDPGYINFPWTEHWVMNKPSDHNMILVDPIGQPGESPRDPLNTSAVQLATTADWRSYPGRPTPIDGEAYLDETLDTSFVDASTVTSTYGNGSAADVRRRFVFVDDAYSVIADDVSSPIDRTFTWPLHGNGGGTDGVRPAYPSMPAFMRGLLPVAALPAEDYTASGGSFSETATGATWARPNARVTVGMAFDGATPARQVAQGFHEIEGKKLAQHDVLRLSVQGSTARALSVVLPSPSSSAEPTITELSVVGGSGLVVADPGGDRRVVAIRRPAGSGEVSLLSGATGVDDITTDGSLVVVDTHLDGTLRTAYAEDATSIAYGGATLVAVDQPGTLAVRLEAGRLELLVDNADPSVTLSGLGFTPVVADGACGLTTSPDGVTVALGRERRVTLRSTGANSAPAADPGDDVTAAPGPVVLDGSASCDAEGHSLTPRWRITSAPPPSTWTLQGPTTWTPTLDGSVPGLYRLQLSVVDEAGHESLERELVVRVTDGALFTPMEPVRVQDSRPSSQEGPYDSPWRGGITRPVVVAGVAGVPADAEAVALNVTVTGTTASSYLAVWPNGEPKPLASSLNWQAGWTIPNAVTVKVGDGGQVNVFNNNGAVDVIVDVVGYYRPASGAGFTPLAPVRIQDSRPGSHVGPYTTPWATAQTRQVKVAGVAGVPADAEAVVLNTTVTGTTASSFLSLWPSGTARPLASNLNWKPGSTIPNAVTVKVGAGGLIDVYNNNGAVDVVMDVVGYFRAGAGVAFHPLAPARIQDSRPASTVGPYTTPWAGATSREVIVSDIGGVPTGAVAVLLNVTVTATSASSYLTLWPRGASQPVASSLNWKPGFTIPNAVTAKVGSQLRVNIYNNVGTAHVVADVNGWYG
jgi:hypothetical protein